MSADVKFGGAIVGNLRHQRAPRPHDATGFGSADSPRMAAWTLDYDADSNGKFSSPFVDGIPSGNVTRGPHPRLEAGEVFFVPAETVHAVKNVGSGNASELATCFVEKRKPLVIVAERSGGQSG